MASAGGASRERAVSRLAAGDSSPALRVSFLAAARMEGRRGVPACSLLAAALASAPRCAVRAEGTAEDAASLRRKYALASRTLTAQTRMVEQLRDALRARDAEVDAERVRSCAVYLTRARALRSLLKLETLTPRRAARVAGGAGGATRARVRAASLAGAAGGAEACAA